MESGRFVLPSSEVHVWQSGLNASEETLERLSRLLSADERLRAERFAFAHLRMRFIVARGVLRTLVGLYAGIAPEEVVFAYGKFGKPALNPNPHANPIGFNVSHSGDFALFAFVLSGEVGVDIEYMDEGADALSLAEQFLSPQEYSAIFNLPSAERNRAFYRRWTRKEALLKATGEGIGGGLSSCAGVGETELRKTFELLAPAGYQAAVAVENQGYKLARYEWRETMLQGVPRNALGS